jgi:GNAT superfamily N-acetyltransferase
VVTNSLPESVSIGTRRLKPIRGPGWWRLLRVHVTQVKYDLEQCPRGGWCVRAAGFARPLSHHDTEEEAEEAVAALTQADADEAHVATTLDGAAERVRLRDGSVALIRPVTPADRCLFVEGFERFGADSRMSRFLGAKRSLTEADLDFFTMIDHECHEAIGAIAADDGAGVGVARMVREANGDPRSAEAAVAVVDEWQGRGLGSVLLARLAERARELGVDRFLATLRTDNRAMMTLFQRVGAVRVRERDGNVVTIEVELPVDGPGGALEAALRSAAAGRVESVPRSSR